ncbi:MAG TPA: hypothetical protein VGE01_10145 [Fimbriimonas sp.]
MLWTPRLQWDEGRGILARRCFYQALLAGSALFTAGIGYKTQVHYDDFEPIAYGPVHDERIEGYAEPLRKSAVFEVLHREKVSREMAREAAQEWIKGYQAGDLEPLTPVAFEDDFDVPAKAQILRSCTTMLNYLNNFSKEEAMSGDREAALEDALLSFEVSSILKYSDLQTVGTFALQQRKALRVVSQSLDGATEPERKETVRRLTMVWSRREPLSKMMEHARNQFLSYARRQGVEVPATEQKPTGLVFHEASAQVTSRDLYKSIKLTAASQVDELSFQNFMAMAAFAYRNEADTEASLKYVVKKATDPET